MAISLMRHLVLFKNGVVSRFLGTGGFGSAASDRGFVFSINKMPLHGWTWQAGLRGRKNLQG
jgi:hypothetical protein